MVFRLPNIITQNTTWPHPSPNTPHFPRSHLVGRRYITSCDKILSLLRVQNFHTTKQKGPLFPPPPKERTANHEDMNKLF